MKNEDYVQPLFHFPLFLFHSSSLAATGTEAEVAYLFDTSGFPVTPDASPKSRDGTALDPGGMFPGIGTPNISGADYPENRSISADDVGSLRLWIKADAGVTEVRVHPLTNRLFDGVEVVVPIAGPFDWTEFMIPMSELTNGNMFSVAGVLATVNFLCDANLQDINFIFISNIGAEERSMWIDTPGSGTEPEGGVLTWKGLPRELLNTFPVTAAKVHQRGRELMEAFTNVKPDFKLMITLSYGAAENRLMGRGRRETCRMQSMVCYPPSWTV